MVKLLNKNYEKIEIPIPNNRIGNWIISSFTVSKDDAKLFNLRQMMKLGRTIKPGNYKRLSYLREDNVVMSNTQAEIADHRNFLLQAHGDILIGGLGLGMCIFALLEKTGITSITVIENSEDVIALVKPYIKSDKVKIIHANLYEWKPEKNSYYDFAWYDIWSGICSDNLHEMQKLHRKFKKYVGWQDSWCKIECLRAGRMGY